jgi:hypothetical protein
MESQNRGDGRQVYSTSKRRKSVILSSFVSSVELNKALGCKKLFYRCKLKSRQVQFVNHGRTSANFLCRPVSETKHKKYLNMSVILIVPVFHTFSCPLNKVTKLLCHSMIFVYRSRPFNKNICQSNKTNFWGAMKISQSGILRTQHKEGEVNVPC